MQESELSILLIEDEPDAAMLIQHVLGKGGGLPLSVDWATDLHTGLERLADASRPFGTAVEVKGDTAEINVKGGN